MSKAHKANRQDPECDASSPFALCSVFPVITDVDRALTASWHHGVQSGHGCLPHNLQRLIVARNEHPHMIPPSSLRSTQLGSAIKMQQFANFKPSALHNAAITACVLCAMRLLQGSEQLTKRKQCIAKSSCISHCAQCISHCERSSHRKHTA